MILPFCSLLIHYSSTLQRPLEKFGETIIIATATHHKTGTVMFFNWWSVVCLPYFVVDDQISCHHDPSPRCFDNPNTYEKVVQVLQDGRFTRFHFTQLSAYAFDLLVKAKPYRLVHVIRDPLEIVVSAYLYHRRVWDTHLVPSNVTPNSHERMSTGLVIEAFAQKRSTLAEITEVLARIDDDKNTLTLGLEDFIDDFREASKQSLMFLFPSLLYSTRERILNATITHQKSSVATSSHVTERHAKAIALHAVEQSNQAIWTEIRGLREVFGYISRPIGWRCRTRHCKRTKW